MENENINIRKKLKDLQIGELIAHQGAKIGELKEMIVDLERKLVAYDRELLGRMGR